jgi:hypothetical protein
MSWTGIERIDRTIPGAARRPLFVALDVVAWVSLVAFFGAGAWVVGGGPLHFVDARHRLPIEALVVMASCVPTLFAIIWLVFRHVRRLTAMVEYLKQL